MKNWINVGRADVASSHEYAPQKSDRPHTRTSVALRTVISEAYSPTHSVLVEGGTGNGLCATRIRVNLRVTRSNLTSSKFVHAQREANGQ
jgi:hypothetical protein